MALSSLPTIIAIIPWAQAENDEMADDPGPFECMCSMRAMRRLKPDPVSESMVERILEAATRAPSSQNTQPWAFLVVTEEASRRFFGEQYRHWVHRLSGGREPAPDDRSQRAREIRAARHLGDHIPDVR